MPQRLAPKVRFQQDTPRTNRWLDTCADPAFHDVLERALVELIVQLDTGIPTEAAAAYYQMAGAKKFINILLNLGEKVMPKGPPTTPQLEPV